MLRISAPKDPTLLVRLSAVGDGCLAVGESSKKQSQVRKRLPRQILIEGGAKTRSRPTTSRRRTESLQDALRYVQCNLLFDACSWYRVPQSGRQPVRSAQPASTRVQRPVPRGRNVPVH